jgi:hypothetical protein
MRRKLTEILVETVETIIIHRRPAPAERQICSWCSSCERQVSLISPDAAAELVGVETDAIYRQLEAGLLHLIEAADGRPMVCLISALSELKQISNKTHSNKKRNRDE